MLSKSVTHGTSNTSKRKARTDLLTTTIYLIRSKGGGGDWSFPNLLCKCDYNNNSSQAREAVCRTSRAKCVRNDQPLAPIRRSVPVRAVALFVLRSLDGRDKHVLRGGNKQTHKIIIARNFKYFVDYCFK